MQARASPGGPRGVRRQCRAPAPAPGPTPGVNLRCTGPNRRQLAVVRELWTERDAVARERDLSPGRVLPDSAIVEAALAQPPTAAALIEVPGFTGRGARRYAGRWAAAVRRSALLSDDQLPPHHLPPEGPPPARLWADRDPAAAARLAAVRSTLTTLATEHRLPVENLLSPELARRLAWEPPEVPTPEAVGQTLRALGARSWNGLVADPLAQAMVAPVDSGSERGGHRCIQVSRSGTDARKDYPGSRFVTDPGFSRRVTTLTAWSPRATSLPCAGGHSRRQRARHRPVPHADGVLLPDQQGQLVP